MKTENTATKAGSQKTYCCSNTGAESLRRLQRELAEPKRHYDAILLASYGGPEGQDEVIPFLRNVTAGRDIPEERLEKVARHYRAFGGISPINGQNRALKKALEDELFNLGIHIPVMWANRNWAPYYREVLQQAHELGRDNLLMLVTSAYTCYSSSRQYREDIGVTLAETGLSKYMRVDKIRQFFDHPGFITPFVEGTRIALEQLRNLQGNQNKSTGDFLRETHVLFCTHSIPLTDAAAAGPPDIEFLGGSAYVAQHLANADVIMEQIAERHPEYKTIDYSLAYQSRSGAPHIPWLEPDVNEVIAGFARQGIKNVVIVPLGFLSSHMEVVWDLDVEALGTAREHGIEALRVSSPGAHPVFVSGLVDLILERLLKRGETEKDFLSDEDYDDRQALTPLGPWFDVAPRYSSANQRGYRPTVAGQD